MISTKISASHAILLLLASISYAQEQPAEASPSSAPFPLDANGEAHFNIPVVVKLADLNAAAAAAAGAAGQPGAPIHRRATDANTVEDAESPQPVAAFDDSAAKIKLAAPAHVEPIFEVAHQGSDDEAHADLEARNEAYNPGAAAAGANTHTVLLVETTGTVVSTITGPCSTDTKAVTPSAPTVPTVNNTTTTTTTATSTIIHTAGVKPPVPLNHTSYPLRNGTNSTLPNGGGAGKATGLGIKASGTGAAPVNPANSGKPSPKLTGDGVSMQVGSLMAMGVGALVVALVV